MFVFVIFSLFGVLQVSNQLLASTDDMILNAGAIGRCLQEMGAGVADVSIFFVLASCWLTRRYSQLVLSHDVPSVGTLHQRLGR